MSQRVSDNNLSVNPSKTVASTKKQPEESSTTKLPAKFGMSAKLKASTNRLVEMSLSTSARGIFRQRTGLSLRSTNSRSVTSPNLSQRHEPLRKRSLSNIEINRKPASNKLFGSTTKLSSPRSARTATLSHYNTADHSKVSFTTVPSTAILKPAATASRLTTVKKVVEKKTLETQLSTKRKLFNYEKGRLLNAQTQVLGIYKSIEELQSKLQRLSGTEQMAKSEPMEKLKLVAYHPDANNLYICKDSAATFAITAEKQRRATIERFRQSIGDIGEELTHHHNVGFDTCHHIVQQMCKCFLELKKGRPFEVDLYTKKMQISLKDIELSLMQKQQDECDRLHAFLTKTEKTILCEIMTANDRKRLLEVGVSDDLPHQPCDPELEQCGDQEKTRLTASMISDKTGEWEQKLRLIAGEKDSEILRLRAELDAARNCGNEPDPIEKISEWKNEIERLNEKLGEIEAVVTEYKQIIEELNCTNKELNEQLKMISTSEVADEERKENAVITAAQHTDSIDIRTKAIVILKRKLAKAKAQLKEQQEAIIMHHRLLHIRSELISTMQAKESQANYQAKELRSEIDCNNNLFERMKSELMTNGNEIAQLKIEMEKKEKEANRLHNENKQLRQNFREIMGFAKL